MHSFSCTLTVCVMLLCMVSLCEAEFGYLGYSEYREGDADTRLVIVSPHGGYTRPENITDRTDGCWDLSSGECVWEHDCGSPDEERCSPSIVNDYYTQELAGLIVDELTRLTDSRPHLIINHLHRSKMDANREVEEAAMGNTDAERAWADFHGFIETAKAAVPSESGLVLDIHGHGHEEPWIELGYLYSKAELDSDEELDPEESSIRHLSTTVSVAFDELLRGATSFGGQLELQGYEVVPGPEHPGPDGGNYFSGGYITQRHGSRDQGTIDAIQIESPRFLRDEDASPEYAEKLSSAVVAFMQDYYPATGGGGGATGSDGSPTGAAGGVTVHVACFISTMLIAMIYCCY